MEANRKYASIKKARLKIILVYGLVFYMVKKPFSGYYLDILLIYLGTIFIHWNTLNNGIGFCHNSSYCETDKIHFSTKTYCK